ncbi:MAG: SAM-dependent methyltransferase [Clostridia bacterium]
MSDANKDLEFKESSEKLSHNTETKAQLKQTISEKLDVILQKSPLKIVLSKAILKDEKSPQKLVITKLEGQYTIESFTKKQAFTKNILAEDLKEFITNEFYGNFLQLTVFTTEKEYSLGVSKKGKLLYLEKATLKPIELKTAHNREKSYILKENEIIPPLIDMGIFTSDGKIVKAMNSKYRQINRFIEIIDDVISKKEYKTLKVIDFGCGKGYLTFLLYYYLTEVKKIDATIVGIDLKEEVVLHCNQSAEKYGYKNLSFIATDIFKYETKTPPDMVLSLHACDIATDFVLYNAIRWNAKMIFSMPCCQHEINSQIKSDNFAILTNFGMLKENLAAIFTDCIRCNMLTYYCYKVDVIDVVNPTDTPKNTLIRATLANVDKKKREKALKEVQDLSKEFNLSQTLVSLLKDMQEKTEKN